MYQCIVGFCGDSDFAVSGFERSHRPWTLLHYLRGILSLRIYNREHMGSRN